MPVGVRITMPDTTRDEYEQINRRIFGKYPIEPHEAPTGLVFHTAGPAAGGWYVYDVWSSEEDFRRFGREHVEPAVQDVLGRALDDRQVQFYEIANLLPAMNGALAA